jgi:hypothetical protein
MERNDELFLHGGDAISNINDIENGDALCFSMEAKRHFSHSYLGLHFIITVHLLISFVVHD